MTQLLLKTKIILASTSPRRITLLKFLGLKFTVFTPMTDETELLNESPTKLTRRLALEKASTALLKVKINHLIIAADTVVVSPDRKSILGKPKNNREAARMLRTLSGKTHTVFTSYAILFSNKKILRTVKTRVTLMPLSPSQIKKYIQTKEPMDKAGAYAAQGLGMIFIKKINGSYTNVIGLPTVELLEDLNKIIK